MPFNFVGLSDVLAVKPGDPVHFRYWYEHFWEVVEAGFLLDLHGAWSGECLQLCMDRDDVERCMDYLDGPPDWMDLGPFMDMIGSFDEQGMLVNN
ncbi:hypothetical protein RvY_01986 [Ramazzottius varieornatus]|uniref:Uncharacterized protein n=1 Tax=Ramazzottius varieornatus TaxID=947166 RepID=A0A1D1UQ90_RAMVA|nr:hypothetical protein RvY_01986 [Ramazzottius varieornatus]